jgi:hypothetical protein
MESGVKTTRRWCSFHDLLIETTIFCQDEGRYKGVVGSASNQLHSILFSKLFRRSLSLSIIEYLCQDEGRYKGVVGSASNQWFTHRIHHIFFMLIWNRIVTLASSWPVSAGHRSSVIGHRSIAEMLPGHCWVLAMVILLFYSARKPTHALSFMLFPSIFLIMIM